MNFNDQQILKVWNKAMTVDGYDPAKYRKDACGAWIVWDKYGVQDNIYAWQIDHIVPQSLLEEKGVNQTLIDDIENLRPLQYQNNASKGDDYPSYTAAVTSDGNKNINLEKNLVVNEQIRKILSQKFGI